MTAHELAILGECDITLEDARSHPTARFVGFLSMLRKLQGRPTMPDREVVMPIPSDVVHTSLQFVLERTFC
jgi:hypothetical protein